VLRYESHSHDCFLSITQCLHFIAREKTFRSNLKYAHRICYLQGCSGNMN